MSGGNDVVGIQQPGSSGSEGHLGATTPVTITSSSAAGSSFDSFTAAGAALPRRPRLLDEFTRRYVTDSKKAYNLAAFLIPSIRAGWVVFSTAMYYYHAFVAKHGSVRYDPLLVITAATFLGCKAEHFRVKLSKLVALALDCPPEAREHETRKAQVVTMELMLVNTLGFDFVVIHPIHRMHELAPESTTVGKFVGKLYAYTCVSPLQLRVKNTDIAVALVWIVSEGLGEFASGGFDKLCRDAISEDLKAQVYDVVLDVLYFMGKKVNIPAIDEAVVALKRSRGRGSLTGTPTPMPSTDHGTPSMAQY